MCQPIPAWVLRQARDHLQPDYDAIRALFGKSYTYESEATLAAAASADTPRVVCALNSSILE